MPDTRYMLKPFGFKFCIKKYMNEIKRLRYDGMPEEALRNLKAYHAAAYAFHQSSLFQLAVFIVTYHRPQGNHALKLHKAMDTMLGETVLHPTPIDYQYLLLLRAYAVAFKGAMRNIRDFIIRSALTSPMSPVSPHVDRAIDHAIGDMDSKLSLYRKILKID